MPFMLAVKGQLKTVELSLLRFDDQNLFLSKPESAPPVEQKWRVAPLRWSAEREPFCIITHRETSRLRLVVAKPDAAIELWPVMYSSDRPDGGIVCCSISPARCKLVPFMWQSGLFVLALDRVGAGGAVLQINAPQEPWVCVRDIPASAEWINASRVRVTPFYHRSPIDGSLCSMMLVQDEDSVTVRRIIDPAQPWQTVATLDVTNGPMVASKVKFAYCRLPPQLVTPDKAAWPLAVYATWTDGCTLFLASVSQPDQPWQILTSAPVPPHTRLGLVYVPFLPEPLLVATSMDPHYVGSVAVRRLFLAERELGSDEVPPLYVQRYMQVPALPVAIRDLSADLPITDLPFREFVGDFVGKRLPYDLTPPGKVVAVPPPPPAPSHGPVPLLLGGSLASLQGKRRLDWVPGPHVDTDSQQWRVTPLRWAPGREVLFAVLQSKQQKVTRVAVVTPDVPCSDWGVQIEFPDSSVPFSECTLVPFQYQTIPGASDMFVLVLHSGSGKGGLFFVANPKSEWQFVREVGGDEAAFLRPDTQVKVMYHRSKDPQNVNVCTFFLLSSPEGTSVRVVIEPNQPTFDLGISLPAARDVKVLYAFSPKPPVTHVWPVEVFVAYVDHDHLVVAHVPSPESFWRPLYSLQVPEGSQVAPVYLPYLAEPLLLNRVSETAVDMLRLNLVENLGTGTGGATFVHRYLLNEPVEEISDVTLDSALVWIPQMGLQGMHPYCGYPLPAEPDPSGQTRDSV